MVETHMPGAVLVEPPGTGGEAIPELVAADDDALLAQSPALAQLGLEAFWLAANAILGLKIGHSNDASKTAVKGGRWINFQWVEDVSTVFTLPLGAGGVDIHIARVLSWYKHLGTEIDLTVNHRDIRERIVLRLETLFALLGRLGSLTLSELRTCVLCIVRGVLGYYGRATPIGRPACLRIDRAVLRLLAKSGHRRESDHTLL
eukprot:7377957-Prymnesium_polylepis.1